MEAAGYRESYGLRVTSYELENKEKIKIFNLKPVKMKQTILFIMILFVAATAVKAQTWEELTDEQKITKLKSFRADNQKYLKTTLGMTQVQLDDIDNVNICYLSTLDRINRYAKADSTKNKIAEFVSKARWAQLDAIMGADKHKQYAEYLADKIKKASK